MVTNYLLYQPFPILDLNDIVLRELTDSDAQHYFDYMTRPEMMACLTKSNIPLNVPHALQEVRYWASLFQNKRSFYWAIALKENNQLIGTAGFNVVSIPHLRAEISYDLDSIFWNRGIMLKSIKAILTFADLALGLVRIQASVITDNDRSIKVLERCHFVNEGLLKKYEIVAGEHKDYYMYARVRL